MSDIQKKVISVIACTFCISLFLIFLSAFYLRSNGIETPIQTSISLIGNYVGAITTLAAAYIASLLFNDWRVEHKSNDARNVQKKLQELQMLLDDCYKGIMDDRGKLKDPNCINYYKKMHENFQYEHTIIQKELKLYISIFNMNALKGDLTKTTKHSYELDFYYFGLIDIFRAIENHESINDHSEFARLLEVCKDNYKVNFDRIKHDFDLVLINYINND